LLSLCSLVQPSAAWCSMVQHGAAWCSFPSWVRRSRGAGEQGSRGEGELRETARPGLTLPEQGCVRLREAARRQGLAAWAGRRQLHGVEEANQSTTSFYTQL
jgi:hypothetical protein